MKIKVDHKHSQVIEITDQNGDKLYREDVPLYTINSCQFFEEFTQDAVYKHYNLTIKDIEEIERRFLISLEKYGLGISEILSANIFDEVEDWQKDKDDTDN